MHEEKTKRLGRLALTRKEGELIRLTTSDGPIEVIVETAVGNRAKLVFVAPTSVRIMRGELTPRGNTSALADGE